MAKAKKLPSGNWRVQVFSHKDASGKNHYESFTASTKAEAEMLAATFAGTKHRTSRTDMTVIEAIQGYINAKEAVLSPSTIREYKRAIKRDYDSIASLKIKRLTSEDMQLFISRLSATLAPKTVKNRYALLTASIGLYAPDMVFRVTFPQKQIKRPVSPSDEMVKALYENASDKLKPCLALAMCGLRRGEICALKYEDIKDGVAHIHADMVQNANKEWVYKEIPKTDGSDRFIKLPPFVLDHFGSGTGFIIQCTPNAITQSFGRLTKRLGYSVRLHDLRHYYASIGSVLGIPDIYMADMGGWRHDSKIMKEVYQNKITSMADYYSEKINNHLNKLVK